MIGFILWSSAGVGELNDKLEMMIENFPNTKLQDIRHDVERSG